MSRAKGSGIRERMDGGYQPPILAEPAAMRSGEAERAKSPDFLHQYWTSDPRGLAKWRNSSNPLRTLRDRLVKHVGPRWANVYAFAWYEEVLGRKAEPDHLRDEDETAAPADETTADAEREPRQLGPKRKDSRQQRRRNVRRADDGEQLKEYWLRGEGRARWSCWTELYQHLRKHLPDERAKRTAAQWFHERFGFWPGADKNRVRHGEPPRGDRIGPG